jgi:hypothetical protein
VGIPAVGGEVVLEVSVAAGAKSRLLAAGVDRSLFTISSDALKNPATAFLFRSAWANFTGVRVEQVFIASVLSFDDRKTLTFSDTDAGNVAGNARGLNTTLAILKWLGLVPESVEASTDSGGSAVRRLKGLALSTWSGSAFSGAIGGPSQRAHTFDDDDDDDDTWYSAHAAAAPHSIREHDENRSTSLGGGVDGGAPLLLPRHLSLALQESKTDHSSGPSSGIAVYFNVLLASVPAANALVATVMGQPIAAAAEAFSASANAVAASARRLASSDVGVTVDKDSVQLIVLSFSYSFWGLFLDFLLRNIFNVLAGTTGLVLFTCCLCAWETLKKRALKRSAQRALAASLRARARAVRALRMRLLRSRLRQRLRAMARTLRLSGGKATADDLFKSAQTVSLGHYVDDEMEGGGADAHTRTTFGGLLNAVLNHGTPLALDPDADESARPADELGADLARAVADSVAAFAAEAASAHANLGGEETATACVVENARVSAETTTVRAVAVDAEQAAESARRAAKERVRAANRKAREAAELDAFTAGLEKFARVEARSAKGESTSALASTVGGLLLFLTGKASTAEPVNVPRNVMRMRAAVLHAPRPKNIPPTSALAKLQEFLGVFEHPAGHEDADGTAAAAAATAAAIAAATVAAAAATDFTTAPSSANESPSQAVIVAREELFASDSLEDEAAVVPGALADLRRAVDRHLYAESSLHSSVQLSTASNGHLPGSPIIPTLLLPGYNLSDASGAASPFLIPGQVTLAPLLASPTFPPSPSKAPATALRGVAAAGRGRLFAQNTTSPLAKPLVRRSTFSMASRSSNVGGVAPAAARVKRSRSPRAAGAASADGVAQYSKSSPRASSTSSAGEEINSLIALLDQYGAQAAPAGVQRTGGAATRGRGGAKTARLAVSLPQSPALARLSHAITDASGGAREPARALAPIGGANKPYSPLAWM